MSLTYQPNSLLSMCLAQPLSLVEEDVVCHILDSDIIVYDTSVFVCELLNDENMDSETVLL